MLENKFKKTIPVIIISLIAGALLLVIPGEKTSEDETGRFYYTDTEEYRTALESETEELLSEIDGVGKCKVMITFVSGSEYLFASDQQTTAENVRKEYVLAAYGGDEQPLLIEERMPDIGGVAVVCGNINATTEYKIIKVLSSLFDIPTNRITVTG